jgi:methylmalonyl-CoA mutase C-terminal domain/subunit
MMLVPRILDLIREQSLDDVVVMVGGTIPSEDIPELRRIGSAVSSRLAPRLR